MPLKNYIQRLQFIDYLINHKATGDLANLANKNRLSKSHTHCVLTEMKENGFPIKYDRKRKTYYYEEEGKMVGSLFVPGNKRKFSLKNFEGGRALSREEMKNVSSGTKEKISIHDICYSEKYVFEKC